MHYAEYWVELSAWQTIISKASLSEKLVAENADERAADVPAEQRPGWAPECGRGRRESGGAAERGKEQRRRSGSTSRGREPSPAAAPTAEDGQAERDSEDRGARCGWFSSSPSSRTYPNGRIDALRLARDRSSPVAFGRGPARVVPRRRVLERLEVGDDRRSGEDACEGLLDLLEEVVTLLDRQLPGTRTCIWTKRRGPAARVRSSWNSTPARPVAFEDGVDLLQLLFVQRAVEEALARLVKEPHPVQTMSRRRGARRSGRGRASRSPRRGRRLRAPPQTSRRRSGGATRRPGA